MIMHAYSVHDDLHFTICESALTYLMFNYITRNINKKKYKDIENCNQHTKYANYVNLKSRGKKHVSIQCFQGLQ